MIKIGYAGILQHHPRRKHSGWQWLRNWVWTYRPESIDASTRSPMPVFLALEKLKRETGLKADQIQFHLWGEIDPYYKKAVLDLKLEDLVSITGYKSKEATLKKLKGMDLLFLPLEKSNSPFHRNLFIPSKLFEYIGLNRPILGLCEDSEAKEILEASGLGINIHPDNENELMNFLQQLISNPDLLKGFVRNQHTYEKYSVQNATSKLVNILNKI